MTAYLAAVLIIVLIYLLLSFGLTIQYGLTGLINFGVVGFFAIGAYTSALLAMNGLPLVLSFLAATVVAGLAAWPIGLIALRLRDDYFAIVTLGFSETVRLVIVSESWLTNGVRGITGVPGLYQGFSTSAALLTLGTLLIVNLAMVLVLQRIVKSPFGRALEAVRDDETALMALGKSPSRFKIQVLILGSALAGLAGAFYGHYVTYIVPDQFIPRPSSMKINISIVMAGQRLGIREVDDGIWLVSFMLLKIWDISTWNKGLCKPSTTLIEREVVTHVLGTDCYLCLRAGRLRCWRE